VTSKSDLVGASFRRRIGSGPVRDYLASFRRRSWPGNLGPDRSLFCFVGEARSNKVTFRGHQFEPLHAVHAHRATGRCPWEGKLPYDGAFWARDTMSRSGRVIIIGSVSCVTSQCDFVGASFRQRSQIGSGPVRDYLAR